MLALQFEGDRLIVRTAGGEVDPITGLGLTFELVSRYDGSLEVVADEAPWPKAVVVKFPRAYPRVDAQPREAPR